MVPSEGQTQASDDRITVSRRQLLKALAAAGGGIAATLLLPAKWLKPIVEVGVLPVHAQVSRPTSTPTPTPTPVPIAIIGCYAFNAADGTGIVPPDGTLEAYADISPVRSVQMRRTISVGVSPILDATTGFPDLTGRFHPANFDLSTVNPPVAAGSTLTILFEFVNPADGTGNCSRQVVIRGG